MEESFIRAMKGLQGTSRGEEKGNTKMGRGSEKEAAKLVELRTRKRRTNR